MVLRPKHTPTLYVESKKIFTMYYNKSKHFQVSFDPTEAEMMAKNSNKKNKPALKSRRKKKVVRPAIFIEAGVHGREWITPAVATWILKELVKFNNTEGETTKQFK